jgi:methylamine dehydrogenase accessory protein MauD
VRDSLAADERGAQMSGWWAASYLVLWLLVLTLAVVVVALARQIGTLHLRLGPRGALEIDDEGPPIGEAPAPIDTLDVYGKPLAIGGPGSAQFLMFVSPGCRVCAEVLPSLPVVAETGDLTPIVITEEETSEARRSFHPARLKARVVADPHPASAYAVPGTPYAVVLDHLGVVRAKGTVNNLEQIEGLLQTAAKRQQGSPAWVEGG